VPDSDWRRWAASVQAATGPRGVDGIQFKLGDDRIVDLCDVRGAIPKPTPRDTEMRGNVPAFPDFDCPPPDRSWLDYRAWVEVEADQGTAELRAIPNNLLKPAPPQAAGSAELSTAGPRFEDFLVGGTGAPGGRLINDQIPQTQDPPPVSVEQRAAPLVVIYLNGWALRACHPIPVPQLTSVNGVKPRAANRLDRGEKFYGPVVVANYGVPVLYARWRLRYVLPEVPAGGVPVPPNPLLGA
jgi:hypothetical protein